MSIIVESFADGFADSTTVTITKPTGLQVGELLVAILSTQAGTQACGTFDTLSGWTEAVGIDFGPTGGSIQYKVATSGDVAASNFTFTATTTAELRGRLLRCSNNNGVDGGLGHASTDSAGSNDGVGVTGNFISNFTPSSNYTPPQDGALVILNLSGGTASTGSSASIATYATVTSGITFTEAFDDIDSDGSGVTVCAAAYGIQPTAAEISEYGATYNKNTTAAMSTYGMIAIFNPPINATGENTLVTTTSTTFTQTGTADTTGTNVLAEATAEAFTQTGQGTSPTPWTNEPKTATPTWNNPDK